MLITEKKGNIKTSFTPGCEVDTLDIEWYEADRRILHKQTRSGIAITLKFLNGKPAFKDGDILFQDEQKIITVEIKACECIVVMPGNIHEASALCYEIGNRHLPLYYEEGQLIIPFEAPVYNLLQACGYKPRLEKRKPENCFKTTVLPHVQLAGSDSLFNKIVQATTTP